ncbi:MAG: hypothetical protein AB7G75_25120 [Candidatus Binatia bacterium]
MVSVGAARHNQTSPESIPPLQGFMSHRKLSEAEASAIWTILNLSSPENHPLELRIVLKPQGKVGACGWMICTE